MIRKSRNIDMVNGKLFWKILLFSLPLMATGVLQLVYNAADMIIVGKYDGKEALAAVGSTSSLINLMVNLFVGLSVGASVVVAQEYGARREKEVSTAVHTSMALSVIAGAAVCVLGLIAAEPMLIWMDAPADVIDQSALYLRIYFLGMPAAMVYNYGASIMRGIGDTRRPLVYLIISGLVNVVLNYILVRYVGLGVAGVAVATVASQIVSAFLVVRSLTGYEDCIRLNLKKLCLNGKVLGSILRIGLPAGFQGAVFSLSNVLIQSSINSFGSTVMAGSSASGSIEGFVYTCMNSVAQGALTFTGQNYGAGKYRRVLRVLGCSLAQVVCVGLIVGWTVILFSAPLLSLYNSDPEVIEAGVLRTEIMCSLHFLCGTMDVLAGTMRGMGHSTVPMIVSLTGACGLRILWINTVFRMYPTLHVLYWSYPVSWFATMLIHAVCFVIFYGILLKKNGEKNETDQSS